MPSAIQNKARHESRLPPLADSRRAQADGIKQIPPHRADRERIRSAAERAAARLDATRSLERPDIELVARSVLDDAGLPASYLGWTMVAVASAYWRPFVSGVPPERRLLILPDNGDRASGLSAALAKARSQSAALGYRILAANQSEAILASIIGGDVDAVIGLAPLDLLEKAVEHVLAVGVPCMAVPLLDLNRSAQPISAPSTRMNGDSVALSFDADWLFELIELPYRPVDGSQPNYVHLLRIVNRLFEPEQLEALAPRLHGGVSPAQRNGSAAADIDPVSGTEAIAYDFLNRGGKHSRPFIVLAVYDAMTGGEATRPGGYRRLAALPESVLRVALSIETFHKASLVHDDIEDDDAYRYGESTLHRRFGVPVAINVGDYLIGLGYRLVSREAKSLGPEAAADILDQLARAHLKLCEGQGAELLWRDSCDRKLSSQDALRIYSLKTAPAFEAALLTGMRLAGPIEAYVEPICKFAESLGTAFQILNDLGDWQPDRHNKLVAAGDVTGGRPTLLWALALERLEGKQRKRLEAIAAERPITEQLVTETAALYREAGVFEKATEIVAQCESQAREVAAALEPPKFWRLLLYLVEMVLSRPAS